ncbi:HdeD family acid-resistance protein [Mycetocola zhadangensis]|uniref:HdeD family acid-resistance protein n=1 Tax=Mycetocola zhadangensis TaxID=1164595 RepID=UPI003A4D9D05
MSYFFAVDPSAISSSQIKTVKRVIILAGLVAVIVGIAILVWPNATLAVVAWLFGVYFVMSGIARIVKAFMVRGARGSYRVFLAVLGVLLVVGGAFVLANPIFGVTVVATLIGFTWILEGIGVLIDLPRGNGTWVTVLFGLISITAGAVVLFAPVAATLIWLQITAVLLILAGLMQVIHAASLRRNSPEPHAHVVS